MRQKSLLGQLESEGLQETVLIQSALQTMWALFGFQTWGLLASPAGSSQDLFAFQDDGPFQSKALKVFSPPRWFRTAPDVLGAVGNMSIAGAIICPRCGTLQCCAILSPNSSLKMGSGLVEKLLQTMDNQLQRIPFPAADGVRASLMSESKFQWKNRSPAGFGVPLGWGWPGTQDRGGLGEWGVKGLIGL